MDTTSLLAGFDGSESVDGPPAVAGFDGGPTCRGALIAIEAARRYHAKGFLLWNPEGIYTEQVLK